MRFKTDENIHPSAADVLRSDGHDAITIWDQSMRGSSDATVADVCRAEKRAIVTLDLDFADIRSYPPESYFGILVLRIGSHSRKHVDEVLQRLLPVLKVEQLDQHLWIVDERVVRIRGGELTTVRVLSER